MRKLGLLIFLGLFSLESQAKCLKDIGGFCGDTHARLSVDPTTTDTQLKLLIGAGQTMNVRLPGAVKNIVVGNPGLVEARYDSNNPLNLILASRVPKGGTRKIIGRSTTIQFVLAEKPVIITVKVAGSEEAVSRLTLSHPVLKKAATRERDIRAEVEAQMREELAEARESLVLRELGAALLERSVLADSAKQDNDGYLIIRTRQILAIGSWVGVVFDIQNRRRSKFELDEVTIAADDTDQPAVLTDAVTVFRERGPITLPFDGVARGIILFRAPPKGAKRYRLTVKELGGSKRIATVTGIGF